jgi:uncharacterized protein involved in response to NO
MSMLRANRWVIFGLGFRIFFLLAGLSGVALMAAWAAWNIVGPWPGAPADGVAWHSHEMVFGFAGAAIAGFLLTAVPKWVSDPGPGGRASPPLQGGWLLLLSLSWIAGRAVQAWAGWVPPELRVGVELLFPAGLAWWVTAAVVSAKRPRNLIVAVVLVMFAVADLLTQVELFDAGQSAVALRVAPHLPAILIAIIGGRIIPAFTTNWLRSRGASALPVTLPFLERVAIPATLVALLADGLGATPGVPTALIGWILVICGGIHLVRLGLWRGPWTLAEPIVAILHIGYLWLPLGYIALGLSYLTADVGRSGAMHLLTAGAMGTMIIAVMSRVALGHTGRTIHAASITVLSYAAIIMAGILRAVSAFVPSTMHWALPAAAGAWIAAFVLFVLVYLPILASPRADGRPDA